MEQAAIAQCDGGLSHGEIEALLHRALDPVRGQLRRVLLLPPDYTRLHSNAGLITRLIYHMLSPDCRVDIMPALGTHVPMAEGEWHAMYGDIPYERMLVHRWRTDVQQVGQIPAELVKQLSEGAMMEAIPVELNRHLLNPAYDLILSIGQVVPHEVAGMANHAKNIFVGCGGAGMINGSHMLGAFYGLERIMGKDHTPVRQLFDYAAAHFLQGMPLSYILTVTDAPEGSIRTHGLFMGHQRHLFEQAVALARRWNITKLDRPVQKAVVYLDGQEFKSTWLGNKAIYRTRMGIADGGELVVLAPGVDKFGEDPAVDRLIRAYGYKGRDYVINTLHTAPDLAANLSAAAHLIHGSSDGRFHITYCTRHLTRQEVEQVGYRYMPYDEALRLYPMDRLQPGENTLSSGEQVYYVPNPALGLWMEKGRLGEQAT